MSEVKFPNVSVKLIGEDGNAFSIMGRVSKAMRRGGIEQAAIDEFLKDAMSGDFNHLLQVVMSYVAIDDDEYDESEDY